MSCRSRNCLMGSFSGGRKISGYLFTKVISLQVWLSKILENERSRYIALLTFFITRSPWTFSCVFFACPLILNLQQKYNGRNKTASSPRSIWTIVNVSKQIALKNLSDCEQHNFIRRFLINAMRVKNRMTTAIAALVGLIDDVWWFWRFLLYCIAYISTNC